MQSRASTLKREFGITVEEYEAMAVKQNHRCAICKCEETRLRKDRTPQDLAVDHDHKSGRNRELLCRACNSAIGMLREDPTILKAALAYLAKHLEIAELENLVIA
jgi:hypothetical protein